jgi:hypothetical protein
MCILDRESGKGDRAGHHLAFRNVICADGKGRMDAVILLWERCGSWLLVGRSGLVGKYHLRQLPSLLART